MSKYRKSIIITLTIIVSILLIPFYSVKRVSAHSFTWWAKKPRTVVLTRSRYIYEIQGTIPRYKNHLIIKKKLRAGTVIKIHHVASYDWIVNKKGLANGYYTSYGKFWVITDSKTDWKDPYSKYEWRDKSLLDGSPKNEYKYYKLSWKQVCKLDSLRVMDVNYDVTKQVWSSTIQPLIEKWNLKEIPESNL